MSQQLANRDDCIEVVISNHGRCKRTIVDKAGAHRNTVEKYMFSSTRNGLEISKSNFQARNAAPCVQQADHSAIL